MPIGTTHSARSLYERRDGQRVSVLDIQQAKRQGERFVMLTAYDALVAGVFDRVGVPLLLVGDTSGQVVFGYRDTVPVTMDQLVPLVQAVVRGTSHSLVVGDLPFGAYQESPEVALAASVRHLKEGGAQAVKLEGGRRVVPQVRALVQAGIPVMGHLGLTPQSVNVLGGYRVQGRGGAGEGLLADARALQDAGVFALVLEAIPADLGRRVAEALEVPTIGIGAGPHCDGQVLVWQDMAGLTPGRLPRYVKRYADLDRILEQAARAFAEEVRTGAFPTDQHSYH
ncbi:MAG TPA: 3-methyl-2-oxobutanoate hydroxymethyltransferase [Actinomycetes bacterium]|jgi:3-methyl-2-oxobutanoate hydroxymethyltransferase|nr:3-methyl-2-oxobutanoate hydroxymethyltransferase [Actinomycetes bacterium]